MARLGTLIARAEQQARTSGHSVLVSAAEAVADLDPLAVVQAMEQAAQADAGLSALLQAGQAFWASPGGELTIAAFGAATVIVPTGPDRFANADLTWRSLLDHAVLDDASRGALGTGPLLIGGFAFDPEGPRTALWQGFPSTHLIAPALHVTASRDGCWLTTTVIVAPDGTASTPLELLARFVSLALATHPGAHAERAERSLPSSLAFTDVQTKASWRTLVGDAIAAIDEGALDKVVVARAVQGVAPRAMHVAALLDRLRVVHRSAYVFGYWRGNQAFVGASPELLVRVSGNDVTASSLAGSARRGATPREDATLAAELLASDKNRTEHAMVHDALRGALTELCDDVTSSETPSLLTLPHVHHLHTAVRARLRAGHSLLALASALHPTPAVGGSPREPALRFLREHERLDRGWYAAPIGWIGRSGGELAVALRSALLSADGRHATLFAGCGIVAESDPEQELAESEVKLRPMQSALEAALGESGAAPELESALERPA